MTEKSNELAHSQDSELDEQNLQELLENVPEDVLIGVIADRIRREPDAEVRKVVRAVSQQEFSGPIPPPSMLGEYDEVHAGLANRIVSMAESQQLHRQTLEKQSIEAAIKTESRGAALRSGSFGVNHYRVVVFDCYRQRGFGYRPCRRNIDRACIHFHYRKKKARRRVFFRELNCLKIA